MPQQTFSLWLDLRETLTNKPLTPGILNTDRPLISPELLVSLSAAPFLVSVLALQASMQALQELGQVSEEIFRGDRLPPLHPPDSTRE